MPELRKDSSGEKTASGENEPGTADFPLVQDKDIFFHKDREDDFDYQISDQDDFDLW